MSRCASSILVVLARDAFTKTNVSLPGSSARLLLLPADIVLVSPRFFRGAFLPFFVPCGAISHRSTLKGKVEILSTTFLRPLLPSVISLQLFPNRGDKCEEEEATTDVGQDCTSLGTDVVTGFHFPHDASSCSSCRASSRVGNVRTFFCSNGSTIDRRTHLRGEHIRQTGR